MGGVLDAMVAGGPIWPADMQPMEIMMIVAGKRGSPEIPLGTAGLDEGLLSSTLSNLVYRENPYSYKKCQ